MKRQGMAFVVSAPSGAGKSTLCRRLLAEFPNCQYSISCTTRSRRPSEVDGRDYFFISKKEFLDRREAGEFAEWAEVHDNFYGTPLAPVQKMLAEGHDIFFDIDVQGAAQIRASLPEAYFVFIIPPDFAELERRLRLRGEDSEDSIRRRLKNAATELQEAFWYDALVVNDDLEAAYDRFRAAYLAASLAPKRNLQILNHLLAQAPEY